MTRPPAWSASRAVAVTAAALALVAPAACRGEAARPDEVARARELYRDGVRQFDSGDLDAALRSFSASNELRPHHETLFNIAGVVSRLGRYVEAIALFERFLEQAPSIEPRRRAELVAEVERLRGLLGRLALSVAPAGAAVAVDGQAAGTAPFAEPLAVDPGERAVVVTRAGHEERRLVVAVGPGEVVELDVSLRPLPARLVVTNAPPGAAVDVDGVLAGTHPLRRPLEVEPGRHVVRARADGFEPTEVEVTAAPGAEILVEMPASELLPPPVLRLAGAEAARVTVDGVDAGALPCKLALEPGLRRIAIAGAGLHDWSGAVRARRGDELSATVRLGRLARGPHAAWVWSAVALTALAGALAIGFGVAALWADREFEDVARLIHSEDQGDDLAGLQARGRDLADDARAYALTTDVSLGVVAAGAVASVVLLALRRPEEPGPTVTPATTWLVDDDDDAAAAGNNEEEAAP